MIFMYTGRRLGYDLVLYDQNKKEFGACGSGQHSVLTSTLNADTECEGSYHRHKVLAKTK